MDVSSGRRGFAMFVLALAALILTAACGGSTLGPRDVAAANALVPATAAATPGAGSGAGPNASVVTPGAPTGTTGTSVTGPGQAAAGGASSTPGGTAGTSGSGTGGSSFTNVADSTGSCVGFHNQTGITSTTITLSNVSDLTGPVPGIFSAAQNAVKAYVDYFNATSTVCGRKLSLMSLDSQTNAGADNTAFQKACGQSFAAIGSMSAFDSGGAATAQSCGLPDLRAIQTSDARAACTTCYAAEGAGTNQFANAIPDYFLTHSHDATQHAAMLYVNEAASASNALGQVRGETRRGWRFLYTAGFDVAEFNYLPYVEQLKTRGVQLVQLYGSSEMAVRVAQAMQSADYHPAIYMMNATSYDTTFSSAGSAVEGSIIYIDFTPIEEMNKTPELALYDRWLQQVSPGSRPTFFGMYAWSAARLFSEQAQALGGRLTRASLLAAIRRVHRWTDHGMTGLQDVGSKATAPCWRFLQLHNGVWHPYGGAAYHCGGSTSTK
ncbi:MAG: amino acid/amide transporter substrate-binding protein family [Marmoricola sp.]|nr:amino acid/amide transporter substrate-binding protein family [Marmoricola sp.]